jgi:hypothetical protein
MAVFSKLIISEEKHYAQYIGYHVGAKSSFPPSSFSLLTPRLKYEVEF